jgi:outer membrane lipoprotein-sorting protein
MLKKTALLCLAIGLLAMPAEAQTLEEVMDSYYEAIGGIDAWKAVKSMKFSGTLSMQGMAIPYTMTFMRPKMVRREFTVQGMTGIQAYDGTTAWQMLPFMGQTSPEVMPPDQAESMAEDADIGGALFEWDTKGSQLELVGKEEVEGTEAFKLKLTTANGDVEYYYLDAGVFLPIKVEGSEERQGAVVPFEVIIGDYKEVNGLMIGHSRENRSQMIPGGQTITMDKVEIDIEIDASIFAMPEEEGGGN